MFQLLHSCALLQGGARADDDLAAPRGDRPLHDDTSREAEAAGVESAREVAANVVAPLPSRRAEHRTVQSGGGGTAGTVHETTGGRGPPPTEHTAAAATAGQ